jgi:phosphate-selective porin OprO/OprP
LNFRTVLANAIFRGALLIGLILAAPVIQAADDARGWNYGGNGWQWSDPGSGSFIWFGLRFQLRYSNRVDEPLVPEDLREEGDEGASINRARYKIGGALGRHFTFYHEYDLRNGQLLDLRGTWKPATWLNVRAGQWKAEYNRERVDSSGKQQFVDRSIANYWFTVDRQNGVMASGRLAPGMRADSSWWLGVFNGNGLNAGGDGGRPMVVGRYQWNLDGEVLPFSQSALKAFTEPRSALAFVFASNDSPYTRFSSSGGGQLPGYAAGSDNQYRIKQFGQEFARHRGGYFQVGWFPSSRYATWPAELEVAARYALVNPDEGANSRHNQEFSLAGNWFFNGHRNKITADLSWLDIEDSGEQQRDVRFRIQWDVSL